MNRINGIARVAALTAACALAACATPRTGSGQASSEAGRPASSAATEPAAAASAAVAVSKPASPVPAKAASARVKGAADAAAKGASAPQGPGQSASASASPQAGAAPAEAPLRPFAEVIKDAKENKGFFTLWHRDERVWIEIRPEQLDQPFLFSTVLSRGIAQFPFVPGLLGNTEVASLRRIGNQVQLVVRNTIFRTPENSPLARAARDSVSDSIVASVPVASAAHPESKSFLIEANPILIGDVSGIGMLVDYAFRTGYALDARNSAIERIRNGDDETAIAVTLHYAVAKLPIPPVAAPPPGTPVPSPPRALADPRSFLLGLQYRFGALPNPPMAARVADERVGYMIDEYRDLARSHTADTRVRVAQRWRLEKKDPAAALSEPKQPIVAYLDRNIPIEWRPAAEAGVLEWNKAFEQAGFKDAIVVKQQPDDADWDTLEGRHIAVKWFIDSNLFGTAAIGPRQTDPRTGEILFGAVLIPDVWARLASQSFGEVLPPRAQLMPASLDALLKTDTCTYAFDALEQAGFSFDLLVERGDIAPGSEAAQRFVSGSIKATVMHEVGHALGLRHNFVGSNAIKLDQLRDAAFTERNGLSASIMDYVPYNVPLETEARTGALNMETIGAYDRWAIEWGYGQFTPENEAKELAQIAARSATDPMLAYATDEDAGADFDVSGGAGLDPRANRFDLGDDSLAYYQRQVKLARELWTRTQNRRLAPDDDYRLYRRNLMRGLWQMRSIAPNLAKFVGGAYVNRDRAGSGRALLVPVEAARQRDALRVLTSELFAPASFQFDPNFMRRLGVDQFNRSGGLDFSLPSAVLDIQRPVLDQLMSETVALRLANAEAKAVSPGELLSFAEVQSSLTDAVWSELAGGRDIGSLRRNLQREHLRRLAGALIRPTSTVAADMRAVQRQEAEKLKARLERAVAARGSRSDVAQAHLAESLIMLREALAAPLYKTGV